jgi:hypothetical protein
VSQIILDDDLRAKLNGLNATMEVREPTGRVVGHFVPEAEYLKLIYAWAKTAVTDEELDKARNSGPGRPLADILKQMGRG